MKHSGSWLIAGLFCSVTVAAVAQTFDSGVTETPPPAAPSSPSPAPPAPKPPTPSVKPGASTPAQANTGTQMPAAPTDVPPLAKFTGKEVLEMRGLDKITGRPTQFLAPIGKPVQYATLTIVARACYSTPQSETPETAAFIQITDKRPDQDQERKVFSGWMYASSPGLNGLDHPLYDVWVIHCRTNAPGVQKPVSSTAPVKPISPDASAGEAVPELPDGADQ